MQVMLTVLAHAAKVGADWRAHPCHMARCRWWGLKDILECSKEEWGNHVAEEFGTCHSILDKWRGWRNPWKPLEYLDIYT